MRGMEVQTQVGGRLRADIGRLHEVLNTTALQGIASVGRIAERVCEAFDLRDGRGRLQRASCRQALRALEAGGHVSLPAPRCPWGGGRVARACAGAGRQRRTTLGLEYPDGARAPARGGAVRRPSVALSGRLGTRLVGSGGVCGLGAAAAGSRRLFDTVRNAPVRGACTVEVKRLSARVKASKQAPKPKRPARLAEMTLRHEPVALPCPGAAPVELWAVHAREEHPPANAKPLEWFVLTTLPVTGADDARRILHYYTLRWRIEDYFRILKSGCKVEQLQHRTAERLQRAIAIKMVVGWRIQLMLRLGREMPELPPEWLFSDIELRVLAAFARSRKLDPPTHLGETVQLLARLGGWLGRTTPVVWPCPTHAHGHRLPTTRRTRITSPE